MSVRRHASTSDMTGVTCAGEMDRTSVRMNAMSTSSDLRVRDWKNASSSIISVSDMILPSLSSLSLGMRSSAENGSP